MTCSGMSAGCYAERAQCRDLSYQRLFNAQGGVPVYSPGRLIVVAALVVQPSSAMCGGPVTSAGLLQSTSSWHQRLWITSAVRPLSQWLSTPARSRMSEPTSSQSRLIWDLAAETTLAAMCAACVGCSGRDRARQYSHSCVMTSKQTKSLPQAVQPCGRLPWTTPVVCQQQICMQWRCWLLGHCRPYGCKPLPNCLGHWAAEHDMAEAGQLILAGCMWAEV